MKKKGIWVVVSVLVVLGLLLGGFGCKAPPPAAAPPAEAPPAEAPPAEAPPAEAPPAAELKPVKLAALLWLTGGGKAFGERELKGITLAVEQINAAGGILGGRQVDLTAYDMGYAAEQITSTVKKAFSDGTDAIIGGIEPVGAMVIMQLAEEAGMAFFMNGGGDERTNYKGYPGFFKTCPNERAIHSPFFDFAETQAKTTVILAYDIGYSRAVAAYAHERWDKAGSPMEILDEIWIDPSQTDLSIEMTKALSQNPDYILGLIWGEGMLSAYTTAKELGFDGLMHGASGSLLLEVFEAKPEVAEGVYDVVFFSPDPNNPSSVKYMKEFSDRWGPEWGTTLIPSGEGTYDYVGTQILLRALDIAGTTTDVGKIARAYHKVQWITPKGEPTLVLPDHQVVTRNMNLVQIQGGKLVRVRSLDVPINSDTYEWWKRVPENIWWTDND